MINGPKLTVEPLFFRERGSLNMAQRPTCICRTCGTEFREYKGMRRVGSGIGYCQEHNGPKNKRPHEPAVEREELGP
jgi:hypothetical protein